MRDYKNDFKAFDNATLDFFYDDYFKGEEGHDYTDRQVQASVYTADIEDCLATMRGILYKHFGVRKMYQIRYVLQESINGVEWHNVADCMSEEEALEELKELRRNNNE